MKSQVEDQLNLIFDNSNGAEKEDDILTTVQTAAVYSIQEKLREKELERKRAIYEEIRSQVKHLCK